MYNQHELVKRVYKMASLERQNDPVCLKICRQIESGSKDERELATGWRLKRIMAHEQEAWARYEILRSSGQAYETSRSYLYHACPWLKLYDEQISLEAQAARVIEIRAAILSAPQIRPTEAGRRIDAAIGRADLSIEFEPAYQRHVLRNPNGGPPPLRSCVTCGHPSRGFYKPANRKEVTCEETEETIKFEVQQLDRD